MMLTKANSAMSDIVGKPDILEKCKVKMQV